MKSKNNILLYILVFIEIIILIKSKIIVSNVITTTKLFIYNIFPNLIPTMIMGSLLINQGIYRIIPSYIGIIFNKLFNFNQAHTSIFFMSMFCGSPANALYINEYLNKNIITSNEAESLLCCTHFINPLFVINGIGAGIFNNIKIGFLIYVLLIIENLLKAYLLRNNFISDTNLKNSINKFINSLINSINISMNSCILILGMILVFNILICLIDLLIPLYNIKYILTGILEITSGILNIKHLHINLFIKMFYTYYLVNFGGICIHIQTISMIKNKKIRYFKYLIFRII